MAVPPLDHFRGARRGWAEIISAAVGRVKDGARQAPIDDFLFGASLAIYLLFQT